MSRLELDREQDEFASTDLPYRKVFEQQADGSSPKRHGEHDIVELRSGGDIPGSQADFGQLLRLPFGGA